MEKKISNKPATQKKNIKTTNSKPINKKTAPVTINKSLAKATTKPTQVSTVSRKPNNSNNNNNNSRINRYRQPNNLENNIFSQMGLMGMGMNPVPLNNPRNRSQNPNNRIDPVRNPLGFLQNFFAGFGVEFPVRDILHPQNRPQRPNQSSANPEQILSGVHQHEFNDDIYDPSFDSYGGAYNERFRNNYSSNFRSNLEREIFDQLLSIIQGNRWEATQSKHPPTKSSVLQKLKKFDMIEKYCKKDEKGNLEYPNCCICINDIKKGEKTVMIPCGHLLHWKCGLLWLRKNNTCPVCRFELPGEKYHH